MTNFSKGLAILATFFAVSAANATLNFDVSNNTSEQMRLDFCYYVNLLDSKSVPANQSTTLSVNQNSVNIVKVRPTSGMWSGPIMQFPLSDVKLEAGKYKLTISTSLIQENKITIKVESSGRLLKTSTFIRALR